MTAEDTYRMMKDAVRGLVAASRRRRLAGYPRDARAQLNWAMWQYRQAVQLGRIMR